MNYTQFRISLLAVMVSFCLASEPSLAQFTTIIDAPPTVVGGNFTIHSDTQMNVMPGGVVFPSFNAGDPNGTSTNVEVNVTGGDIGRFFDAFAGSTVNISGGTFDNNFDAKDGSTVNISGGDLGTAFDAFASTVTITDGTFQGFSAYAGSNVDISKGLFKGFVSLYSGSNMNVSGGHFDTVFRVYPGGTATISGGSLGEEFDTSAGSSVELKGGDFKLNGSPFTGSSISLNDQDVLSGTFSDGSPFVIARTDDSNLVSDSLENVVLTTTALPPIDTTPIVVNAPYTSSPNGLRPGQQLTLQAGGSLPRSFKSVGADLLIQGGTVNHLDAVDSLVQLASGSLGDYTQVFSSQVNISGGSTGTEFNAYDGSTINMSGGTVGQHSGISNGAVLNLSGGQISNDFEARPGSTLNVMGGTVGLYMESEGATVNVSSGEIGFRYRATDGSEINVTGGTIDTQFAAASGTVVNVSSGLLDDRASFSGSSLVVTGGAVGDSLSIGSSSNLSMTGGTIGDEFRSSGTSDISGGVVGNEAFVTGGEFNINSGIVGNDLRVRDHAILNIRGGTVGPGLDVEDQAIVNITGGTIGDNITIGSMDYGQEPVLDNITVNISGGTIGSEVRLYESVFGNYFNILGTEFLIDGVPLTGLIPGTPVTITQRDVALTGTLADGSAFDFDLNGSFTSGQDYFQAGAFVTVTLSDLGDFNGDLRTDGLDFLAWQRGESPNPNSASDLQFWEAGYGTPIESTTAAVPEPSSIYLLGFACLALSIRFKAP